MIPAAPNINLGLDTTRIRDARDAERQHATVEEILRRMFDPIGRKRWELQILADEVGLGKTFVALAVAYSLLSHLRAGKSEPDLDGCYQKVLVITPHNGALYHKWHREVAEFVKRCVVEQARHDAATWFAPVAVDPGSLTPTGWAPKLKWMKMVKNGPTSMNEGPIAPTRFVKKKSRNRTSTLLPLVSLSVGSEDAPLSTAWAYSTATLGHRVYGSGRTHSPQQRR
jgi:SNF2-related domain